jgi:hypothetical protein
MRAGPSEEVDHKNNDGLINTFENMRLADRQQQSQNTRKLKPLTSPYKGVCLHRGKWRAVICDGELDSRGHRKQRHLGTFSSDIEAAIAYDQAAKKSFGQFASLNSGV